MLAPTFAFCTLRLSVTMAKKLTGRCACGSIRYQLLAQPMFVHCCHCDDRQRLTGGGFVLNAIIETQAIKLLPGKPVAVPVPRGNGSHDIYRCPNCQTGALDDYGHKPNLRFVRVGTLDKPGALKATLINFNSNSNNVPASARRMTYIENDENNYRWRRICRSLCRQASG
jgi:hypothetical protein